MSDTTPKYGQSSELWPPPGPSPDQPLRRPLWRRRWFLFVACVLVVAVITGTVRFSFSLHASPSRDVHGDASGSPTAIAAPAGYQTVVSARGGYSLAVPKGWVFLDLSADTLANYAMRFRTTAPRLADYFSANIWSHDGGLPYTDFFAADPDSSTPTPLNVRGEHFAQAGNPVDHMADFRSALRAEGLTGIQVRQARVAGRQGVIGSGVFVDAKRSLRYLTTDAFIECRPAVQCIFVFYVPESPRNTAIVNEIIRTLSVR